MSGLWYGRVKRNFGKVAELVEGTTLLTWQGLIALAGSNPALSALTVLAMKTEQKIFYHILGNTLLASVTNGFVWFAITFWVFLETRSILATAIIAGIFAITNALSAFLFGAIVDHWPKKRAMLFSSFLSLFLYVVGATLYFANPSYPFTDPSAPLLWVLIVILMVGSVTGNLRMIALSVSVTHLFEEKERPRANGLVGTVQGISFACTSVLSGMVMGFFGIESVLWLAVILTGLVILHLAFIHLPIEKPAPEPATDATSLVTNPGAIDVAGTIALLRMTPGLLPLIFFTTFNNFLGGVFMALMDAYGLSLVSVQIWGTIFGVLSFAFILGGMLVAKYGLGKNPVHTFFFISIVTWTVCIFFTIQPWVWLLVFGMFVWMVSMPVIEAAEHTIIQNAVPVERQGRAFGFAQSVESAASPVTTFLIGPITHFFFVPFMTTGLGAALIGPWFGMGQDRAIALVFVLTGLIGLTVTLFARRSRSAKRLAASYPS